MTEKHPHKIVLASASSRRMELLQQINVTPSQIVPANIDETPKKQEKPNNLSLRLAEEKAKAVFDQYPDQYILAADTVVACGQQILEKPENAEQAHQYLKKLSGRRHHVHGGIAMITPQGQCFSRHCNTLVQFKPLSPLEIENYIQSGEWEGKAGGYAIQGYAGSFVKYMAGSYSNVVGLSLYDTIKLMRQSGFE